MTHQRLSKILARAGVASRRKCEELIFAGRVAVNGKTVLLPQHPVSDEDRVVFDGKEVEKEEEKVYFLLNKPAGYVCSNDPSGSKKRVVDLFKDVGKRVFTVGRLDKHTTGLLIVTNDGHFANRVIHPRYNIQKEYLVKTEEEVEHEHLQQIGEGMVVEGTFVKPLRVEKVRKGTLKVVVKEGKKREVRRMVESTGLTILHLSRIRIGDLTLGSLDIGAYRPMKESEKQLIMVSNGGN